MNYRESPISVVLWGKDKTTLIESALIKFSNKNNENRGNGYKIHKIWKILLGFQTKLMGNLH